MKQYFYSRRSRSFSDFLDYKLGTAQQENEAAARLQEWERAVKALYILIYDWLNDYTYDGRVKLVKAEKQLCLENGSAVMMHDLHIYIGPEQVVLSPEMMSMGSNTLGHLIMAGPNNKLFISAKADETYTIGYYKLSFFREPLNQESFLKALMELCK